jgi:hypothetical protein
MVQTLEDLSFGGKGHKAVMKRVVLGIDGRLPSFRRVCIHGDRGMGKTQLAIKISKAVQDGKHSFHHHLFLDGSSEDQLRDTLCAYGRTFFPRMPCNRY